MPELIKYLNDNDIEHEVVDGKLTVGGYLDLQGTGITALPDGLTVGGSLYLPDNSEIVPTKSIGVGMKTDRWPIELKNGKLKIGYQEFRLDEWKAMTDDDIRGMDHAAIKFCEKYRQAILDWISKYPEHCVEV